MINIHLFVYRSRVFGVRVGDGDAMSGEHAKSNTSKWLTYTSGTIGLRIGGRWFRGVTPIHCTEMYCAAFAASDDVAREICQYLNSTRAFRNKNIAFGTAAMAQ